MVELNKLTDRKLNVITAVILTAIVSGVIAVCFLPGDVVVISNGESYSAIYNGDRKSKKISLTFNVYEGAEIVEGILGVLEEEGVKATFYIGGCWADDNEKVLSEIAGSGNELGNHGYFHRNHKKLDYDGNYNEINAADAVITALSGIKPVLFAPPSGSFSALTLNAAADLGYKVIMWSKDTIDWRDSDEKKLISRATDKLSGGDIILMHPKKHTLKVLPEIIKRIKAQGYEIVTVGENIRDSAA